MARARCVDVWIVNKSGGLIYRRAFEDAGGGGRGGLDTNAQLRLASVWHSLHAISRKVAPAETGMKIFITTTKGVVDARGALRRVHQAYCDYALKNPFYEIEMPVNCDLFDAAIANIADAINRA